MAYRRPAIEVIQEFQQAAAALALPTLPACVVGPGFQIKDDVEAGNYSEDEVGASLFEYPELEAGAIVDLTDAPETEAEANAHKPVTVTLKDILVQKTNPAATGTLASPNLFQDGTSGAFSSIDPDAPGAPTYYVEVISGGGLNAADIGRKLVIGKNSNNELIVAAEWQTTPPVNGVTYRIVEFREKEVYTSDTFSANGITAGENGVTINPGLRTNNDSLPVIEATVLLSYRALRPDMASSLLAFTDLDSLEAVFGVGAIVPANIGPYVVKLALDNTTTEVSYTGLNAAFLTNEEQAYQSAFEFLESKDVYGIAACTHNPAVHQLLKSHVEGMSQSSVGRERVGVCNRKLVEEEVLVPPSGIGTVTSAGSGNGLSGSENKTFKDPANGSFITDDVGVGHYLEIVDYTPVPGTQRSITPNERDYVDDSNGVIQLVNAEFVAGDVGRYILLRGATTSANDLEAYEITAVNNPHNVDVNPVPNTGEVLPVSARAWIVDPDRTITHDAADSVVAASKTWTFTNGNFTDDDVGRLLFMEDTSDPGNSGPFTIAQVLGPTQIRTTEAPGANETFGVGVKQAVYIINREPGRDVTADSVDGTTRVWTFQNGNFTQDDVNRVLRIAGASNGGNNDDHTIEAVLSPSRVRTSNATTPVTEEFNGLDAQLTTSDIISVTPSPTEDDYIRNTRHKIAAVVSETQLTLAADPTAGFGGTLEDVKYRIVRDMTLNEQAEFLAGYATSFGTRRFVHTWPDVLAVSVNGQATKVPGYFAGGAIVGMTAGLPSQAGFTNLTLVGFVGRENSDDKFSDTQLDTIAGGGNMILVQTVPGAALSIRHQLTTDVSMIYFQEFSVTKNLDLIARFFRAHFRPFIGIYNITDTLLDLLKTRGEGGISFLLAQRAPRVGAPIRNGQLQRIEESTEQPDSVEIDIGVSVPLPLNNLKIKLLV